MPIAFFSTSRSMRVRSSSRFNRVICDAWSAGDGIGVRPGDAAARDRAVPPRTTVRQFRSIDGEIPTLVATCINGQPLLSSSATASRLRSGENSLLIFVTNHPHALTGLAKVSTESRDHQLSRTLLAISYFTLRLGNYLKRSEPHSPAQGRLSRPDRGRAMAGRGERCVDAEPRNPSLSWFQPQAPHAAPAQTC